MPRRLPTKPRRTEGVAQTCSLPYRRFAIGSRPPGIDVRFPNASELVRYAGPKSTATRILNGFIPEGWSRIAQRLQRWDHRWQWLSPEGTAELQQGQPSLR